MSEPETSFSAIRTAEGEPQGAIRFVVDPDTWGTPGDIGPVIHDLQLHLAPSPLDHGRAENRVMAFPGITHADSDEVQRMIDGAKDNSFSYQF